MRHTPRKLLQILALATIFFGGLFGSAWIFHNVDPLGGVFALIALVAFIIWYIEGKIENKP